MKATMKMKRSPAMKSAKMKFSAGKGATMKATRAKGQRGMAMRAIARKK